MKELIPIPILIRVLERYKDKLKKYRCLEIGGGNLLSSIPISRYFKSYDVVEPDIKLCGLGKDNIEVYDSDITLHCDSMEHFLETTEKEFDIMIFINSIHFLDLKKFRANIKKCKYFIVIHPTYYSTNFGDPRLNRGEEEFDEELWKSNKKILDRYEIFITKNYKIVFEDVNKFRKVFVCKVI
jgi:hypothetical protein